MWIKFGAVFAAIAVSGCSPEGQVVVQEQHPKACAVLQLGRPICGDCCVEQVMRAFDGMEGIGAIEMSPGDVDFSVELADGAPSNDELVAALVAAGAHGARVSPSAPQSRPKKQWVVAR